jgi:hypothetical protein
MDDYVFLIPVVILLGACVLMVHRYFRFGSMLGMAVGARVARSVGKVETERAMGTRRILEVHVLEPEPGGHSMVAVGETTRGSGSYKFSAIKLSGEQARQLAQLLEQAAKG